MSQDTGLIMCFPTLVSVNQVPNHQDLNQSIMSGVARVQNTEPNSIPDGWSCELYTTIGSSMTLLEHDEFKPLMNVIKRETLAFASAMEFDIKKHPLKLTQCWLNVYDEGNAQEIHVHPNNVISGIYYPQAPQGCGDLLIHSPYGDMMLDPPIKSRNKLNAVVKVITPKTGMMVLFRSFVRHSVRPNKTNEQRVSIAFNLTM